MDRLERIRRDLHLAVDKLQAAAEYRVGDTVWIERNGKLKAYRVARNPRGRNKQRCGAK